MVRLGEGPCFIMRIEPMRDLAQLDSVRKVILYGSAVRKRAHEYSDLDMIIVVDKGGERVRELIASEISAGEKIPPNG